VARAYGGATCLPIDAGAGTPFFWRPRLNKEE
jgi:hypothetical protein